MADGFAAGLASGLRGLPAALQYGMAERRKRRYEDELRPALEGGDEIDYRQAAKIAGRHRDTGSMLAFSQLADRRAETARLGTERDQQLMARRVLPYLSGKGDPAAVDRLVKQNPGVVGSMVGLPAHRRVAGVEAKVNPDTGQEMWALRIANSETKSTGPMTKNASADASDEIMWMTPNQVAQGLQAFIPSSKRAGDWATVPKRPDILYNKRTGKTISLPKPNTTMSAKDYAAAWDRRLSGLFLESQFGDTEVTEMLRQEVDQVARRAETASGGKISGLDVLSEAGSIIRGNEEIRNGLSSGDLEQQQIARSALLRGILISMGYMDPEKPPSAASGEPDPGESSEGILDRLFGESKEEEAAAPAPPEVRAPRTVDEAARLRDKQRARGRDVWDALTQTAPYGPRERDLLAGP